MNLIQQLIPALGRKRALQIARAHCAAQLDGVDSRSENEEFFGLPPSTASLDELHIYQATPQRISPYLMPNEPCWVVRAPWFDGHDGTTIRSSRIIMVCKKSGKILYDGSAHDEG